MKDSLSTSLDAWCPNIFFKRIIAGSPRYKIGNTRTAPINRGLKDLELPTDSSLFNDK